MEVLKLMMNHSDLLSRPYSPDLRVPAINLDNFPQFLICKKIFILKLKICFATVFVEAWKFSGKFRDK